MNYHQVNIPMQPPLRAQPGILPAPQEPPSSRLAFIISFSPPQRKP